MLTDNGQRRGLGAQVRALLDGGHRHLAQRQRITDRCRRLCRSPGKGQKTRCDHQHHFFHACKGSASRIQWQEKLFFSCIVEAPPTFAARQRLQAESNGGCAINRLGNVTVLSHGKLNPNFAAMEV